MAFTIELPEIQRVERLCGLVLNARDSQPIHDIFRHWLRKDVAEASGLNSTTVRRLLDGKEKPNKAHKAALCFAITERELNLKIERTDQ